MKAALPVVFFASFAAAQDVPVSDLTLPLTPVILNCPAQCAELAGIGQTCLTNLGSATVNKSNATALSNVALSIANCMCPTIALKPDCNTCVQGKTELDAGLKTQFNNINSGCSSNNSAQAATALVTIVNAANANTTSSSSATTSPTASPTPSKSSDSSRYTASSLLILGALSVLLF
jgi:hypothetical protein